MNKIAQSFLVIASLSTGVAACDALSSGDAVLSPAELSAFRTELEQNPRLLAAFINDPCRYFAERGVELSERQRQYLEEIAAGSSEEGRFRFYSPPEEKEKDKVLGIFICGGCFPCPR